MDKRKNQKAAYNAPLTQLDTENQTLGCRHTNPDICSSADLPGVCAFVREDGICKKPGRKWRQKYKELKNEQQISKQSHKWR